MLVDKMMNEEVPGIHSQSCDLDNLIVLDRPQLIYLSLLSISVSFSMYMRPRGEGTISALFVIRSTLHTLQALILVILWS